VTEAKVRTEYPPVVLHTRPALDMDEEQFFEFCQLNRNWRIERTAEGDLEIMPPTGGETGSRNLRIALQLGAWTERDGTGVAFDSSTGFVLPNGARARRTPLGCVELRSPSHPLATVEAKMREYIENGARLGWLIDPETRRAHVYRPNEPAQVLENPDRLSGEPVLPGFVLDLKPIWEPGL
jgi:Uma2 family endonuclease